MGKSTKKKRKKIDKLSFLGGGGEMGEHIRSLDWSKTAIGVPENWPQSLKTAVRIMLTSSQPIWIGWGKELIYLYNDPYKAIIGGKHPQALGNPTRVVWSEIWDVIAPMLSTAMEGDEGTYVESQLLIMERHGYREETYYTFSYSPIPDDDGSAGGIICANTNDTQRVIGERQLALLRDLAASTANTRSWQEACQHSAKALLENSHDLPFALIYVANSDGQYLQLAGASGIEPDHLAAPTQVKVSAQTPWPFDAVYEKHDIILVENLKDIFNVPLPTGAWDEPPTQAALVPIDATGQTGRGGVMVVGLNPFRLFDDSYQNFLRLVGGQISASIASAQAYEEEKKRAEVLAELDRAKTTFFSNVSHEFRTPLTLMLGPIEDMLEKSHTDLTPATKDQLEVVHRNSLRLLKMVNTMLDFSRIEAGRIQASYEAVDLAAYTAELASVFRATIERAGIHFQVNCAALSECAYIDRDMWEKIVLNLLSNAFKFTLEGEIKVELKEKNGQAQLTISDTGVGIPDEDLPRVFERFHRVTESRGRTNEGTGIGLALVQELIKIHGGRVQVNSKLNAGSQFIVTLPLGKEHLDLRRIDTSSELTPTATKSDAFVQEALRWLPSEMSDEDAEQQWAKTAQAKLSTSPSPKRNAALTEPARILWADDNADMREYVTRLLEERFEVEAVPDGQVALEKARANPPDLVLSDVMMPKLDGFGLLNALRDDPDLQDIPIILLSARAGEEARIEGLEAGADDYLTKPFGSRELLARVDSHLKMAQFRRETNKALQESESRFRTMANTAPAMLWVTEPDASCSFLSQGWYEYTGQTEEEALGFGWLKAVHPDDQKRSGRIFKEANEKQESFAFEYRLRHVDGEYHWAIDTGRPRFDEKGTFLGYIGSVIDIHELKQTEQALKESERRLTTLVSNLPGMAYRCRNDLNRTLEIVSGGVFDITGFTPEAFTSDQIQWAQRQHPDDKKMIQETIQSAIHNNQPFQLEYRILHKDGSIRWVWEQGQAIFNNGDEPIALEGFAIDITDRKHTEEGLHFLAEASRELVGSLDYENTLKRVADLMVPKLADWCAIDLLQKNEVLKRVVVKHIDPEKVKWAEKLHQQYPPNQNTDTVYQVIRTKMPQVFPTIPDTLLQEVAQDAEHLNILRELNLHSAMVVPLIVHNNILGTLTIVSETPNRYTSKDLPLLMELAHRCATSVENAQYYQSAQDEIAERKRVEKIREAYARELARSNEELQQFAYVSSHDLREPLRMVSSYVQLLAYRYKDKLGPDANEYIHYAVDGAKRMQALIDDLLAYSRVGTESKAFKSVDVSQVLDQVRTNLKLTIEENNAQITQTDLPTIQADKTQLILLFQNLISNAIKFRSDQPPQISISVQELDAHWQFCVTDNGIGIAPKFVDRIFIIFQRLHTRAQYSGTGIGLSICKKIVERHNGRIWVESEPGKGSKFFFTLQKDVS